MMVISATALETLLYGLNRQNHNDGTFRGS